MPQGYRNKSGELQTAIRFSDELFERIKLRALKEDKTFSEMVQELCAIGLFDLDESDSHEQAA
jgi:predicted DNA-binding protein